ncbi:hypothetical protein ACSLO9_34030, partial [Escherichia coli]
PLPVQVLEASPKGHYTQLVVQPLGWYNEPLTVVMYTANTTDVALLKRAHKKMVKAVDSAWEGRADGL